MPGAFRHIKMVDGTTVKAFIHGDEFFNYETDENEFLLTPNDKGLYVNTRRRISAEEVQQRRAAARRAPGVTDNPRRVVGHPRTVPRILVVMVQYQDVKFLSENTRTAIDSMFNYNGYNYMGAPGSVRDYFIAQSGGKYKPEFDVVGPVTVDYESTNADGYSYSILKQACNQLDDEVDFSQYDNDGDGYMDLTFMLYAGRTSADGGPEGTIWPHHSAAESENMYDGVYLGNYSCANEQRYFVDLYSTHRAGIGTACHELSHGLGLPDYYDTNKIGTKNLPWDYSLMSDGNWNNEGVTPPNYTIFDKYYMGWETPLPLSESAGVQGLYPSKSGYCVTRSGNMPKATATETVYYIENRQQQGWDEYLPGHGLVIWKVKYIQYAWECNEPNSTRGIEERMTIVSSLDYYINQPFPGYENKTAIQLFPNCTLSQIKENSDGSVNFGGIVPMLSVDVDGNTYRNNDNIGVISGTPLNFEVTLSGYSDLKCELQCARSRFGKRDDFTAIAWKTVSKEELMNGAIWKYEEKPEAYKNTDYVQYRVQVIANGKYYYSNILQFNPSYPFTYAKQNPEQAGGYLYKEENLYSPGQEVSKELLWDCYDLSVQCAEPIAFEKKDGKLVFTMPACPVNVEVNMHDLDYWVCFYDWDGTKINCPLVGCGEDAIAPTPPTHPGFVFTGWDRDITNVHSDLQVYATYAQPEGRDTYEMELAEHLCENYPYAGTYTVQNKNYKFEGSSTRAMVKDKLTFRLKHTATDAGTVYFWWTAKFDENGEPVWNTGTKVAELTTEEALADKEVLYSYWVCNNPQAYSDEKTNAEKIAFKFRYADKNLPLSFDTKPMVFDIYYPQFLKFKNSDRLVAAVSSGDNRYTLKLPSDGEQVGDYVYGMVPARYTDTVFLYGTDAYNTEDCLEFQRLRSKTWKTVDTDVTADGTVCYVPAGFIDTIQITKTVYPVHFKYRKSDGEGGYYSYEDVQYIPCGGSAVMPSLSEIDYDPVYHPFTEWLCENKPDDRRWMNVREELYYGAYYDYIPNPGQYTVMFVTWDDKFIDEQAVSKFEDAVPPTPPTREGYHFIRWDGDYTFVTEDRRIRAVYGQDDVYWTVSFYNDGWYSDLLGTEQVADGEKAVGNMEVYMDDHVFIGWDKPLDEVHSDLNVAAQYEWREMEHHKVTIVAEHGTVTIRPRQVNPDFVNHGTVLFLEAVPDEGYKLSGWEGYSVQFGLAVTQDTTVTALFTPNTPTALEDSVTDIDSAPQKLLRNGILYILRGNRIYTLQGQEVK